MKTKFALFLFFTYLIACSFSNSSKWNFSNQLFEVRDGNNFATEEDTSGIVISNGVIQLKFFNARSGFGLYSLSNLKTGYDFLDGNAREENLWIIKLRNSYNQVISIDNSVKCERTYKIDRDPAGRGAKLNLFWNGIDIGNEVDVLDVQATVRLDGSGLSYWKMNIINKSKMFGKRDVGYGAWVVKYPAIRGMKCAKDANMELAISERLGRLIKNPVELMPFEMTYPSKVSMQFTTLFGAKNNSGLYLAAHDPAANTKKFNYKLDQKDKSLKYEMLNYPEGMGQSANGFAMPYEAVVGVYKGDWITASMIYREWAIRQKWCSKGKLSQRSDFPKWLLNNTLWFAGQRTDKMIPLAKYLDSPVAYHSYDWFDKSTRKDPEYFALDLFPDHVKELHSAGIKIIPYTDARFWNINAGSWGKEHPEPYACKMPFNIIDDLAYGGWHNYQDLVMYMEHWGKGNNQAVMCPFTKGWQVKQSELISGLVSKFDVDGVYMDQISSYSPVLCFDPSHGHTLGGGNYWYEGYRKMVEICKENARKIKKDVILTTEDNAECYIDVVDLHLVKSPTDLIPMFHYVYSGYCITYGRVIGAYWSRDEGTVYTKDLPLKMRNAQMFIWGEQMGWFDPNVVDLPSPEAEYLKTLCQALSKDPVKRYLFYGEMVRPPVLTGENTILTAQWRPGDPNEEQHLIMRDIIQEMPAVLHSAWKGEDGTVGLVFTNMDDNTHTISYSIDANQYQLPQNKKYSVKVIDGANEGKVKSYNSAPFTRTEKMPARSVLILEIKAL